MQNTFMRHARAILGFGALLAIAALTGCGGGGGGGGTVAATSTVITGTAAAGAPVVGYVSVRDSSANPQPVKTNIPIAANGNYSVDVAGLTAPYAFLASGTVAGKTVSLYSAATATDVGKTINITPFTDLMIRNIAATAVDTYLSNPANMANLTTANLDAQRVALTTKLAPALTLMGLSASIDLLRATFNADSTGLDRFMDAVKVDTTTTPGKATIKNILDAANTLVIDTTTGAATGALGTAGLATSAVGTPLDAMLAGTKAFSAFFATRLPNPADPALLAMFSSTFLDNGQNTAAFLTDMTSGPTSIGLKFTNLVVDSVDTVAGTAQIHLTPLNAAGVTLARDMPGGVIGMQMKKNAAGAWQMDGNQRIAGVHVRTTADKNTCNPTNTACTMATFYNTGLDLWINNQAALAIGSAVVTGPGLPAGGVTLAAQVNQTWFSISTINTSNPTCTGCGTNHWNMTDTEIASVLANSVYTVKLYSNAATPVLMATYTEVVPVKPVLNAAKAALAYPSITGMVNLAGRGAATLTPSWTVPAGLSGDTVAVNMWQTGTNATLNVWANAFSASGTSTLAITAPATGTWTSGNYWISGWDQYGGRVMTNYQ